ncbi:UDP-N-acetylmuramoyl-L-alanyl-D-glutamate--2,6-diaminopimelate ligase [Cohnella panacarvi]|uniref:UDP-N-acetylmuramoyl-L-alanyl-D-glutamate--2, 6-diaminopimelate ligase n=1 Tax=Cohnella panacarvi TaxID=400776 RepID=UPI00047DAA93|nr:UDP-N-acetylmuramoyl-L-alanyl-D-glutamate--2,6-diaminopimelate ligase [Cohnella panacarvi]
MNLLTLIHPLIAKSVIGRADVEVTGIQTDSREIRPGHLFVCLQGHIYDGHAFVADAIRNGAAAIIADRKVEIPDDGVPQIVVPDTDKALAVLASHWYRIDRYDTKLIGITGTNGKTTTLHMIQHLFDQHGLKAGRIGTLGFRMDDVYESTRNTTPDVLSMHRYLAMIGERRGEYALIEASSHGLEMGRLRGCDIHMAVFTNLTHDHLDYHETMERYRQSKQLLFAQLGNGADAFRKKAVLNSDDPVAEEIAKHTTAQVLRYGIRNNAEVTATSIEISKDRTTFLAHTPWGEQAVCLSSSGLYNVYNALAAIAVCLLEGLSLQTISESLQGFTGVKGRSEEVNEGQCCRIVIDYAHNPDGLTAILQSLQACTTGLLICVMGSRGNRDRLKRPIMGRIAAQLADRLILTSDNPGEENPHDIITETLSGLDREQRKRCIVIENRQEAVNEAVNMATDNDCIVITGRGHERRLEIDGSIRLLSDRDLVKAALGTDR